METGLSQGRDSASFAKGVAIINEQVRHLSARWTII